jgi:hypothetical protein
MTDCGESTTDGAAVAAGAGVLPSSGLTGASVLDFEGVLLAVAVLALVAVLLIMMSASFHFCDFPLSTIPYVGWISKFQGETARNREYVADQRDFVTFQGIPLHSFGISTCCKQKAPAEPGLSCFVSPGGDG